MLQCAYRPFHGRNKRQANSQAVLAEEILMNDAQTGTAGGASRTSGRIQSLDQFRGYTVVGMLLVNFLGSFEACPQVLRHSHDYCSRLSAVWHYTQTGSAS